jgi:transcription elongation factor SPT4
MCTTAFFEGQVAVMDPSESWTVRTYEILHYEFCLFLLVLIGKLHINCLKAKWIRVDAYLPGVYAISVTGQFDRDMEEELESRGCRWRCRPAGSETTNEMPS